MPSDVRFAVVLRLVRSHGWVLDRVRRSHHVFIKPDGSSYPVPVHHGKIKHSYFRTIQKQIKQAEGETD